MTPKVPTAVSVRLLLLQPCPQIRQVQMAIRLLRPQSEFSASGKASKLRQKTCYAAEAAAEAPPQPQKAVLPPAARAFRHENI